ncbi:dihydrodipicolinate synthase family protein [Promicromonospora sp. NPDC050262]|uniref:dihydrodipicolinate synthase family protein n=1 Tax=Promicromonospora sp. NPDC050262 TaxID=3155036 RepID=UPI003407991E
MPDPRSTRLFAATVTPFTSDGHLDLDALAVHVDRLVREGVDGLVVGGTTGESGALAPEERVALLRAAVDAAGDRAAVVAGVGEHDTTTGIALTVDAARAGADGVLVAAPAASRPSQAGLLAHVRALADAADVPVMLYDNPRRFGVGFEMPTLLRAAEHPNVWAVKDATENPHRAAELMGLSDLAYYAGSDAAAMVLTAGGQGVVGVGVNVEPALWRAYVDALLGGDLDAADDCSRRLAPLDHALHRHVPPAVATKVVLRGLGLLPTARVRLPLVGPVPEETAAIRRDLEVYEGLPDFHSGLARLDHPDAHGGALRLL